MSDISVIEKEAKLLEASIAKNTGDVIKKQGDLAKEAAKAEEDRLKLEKLKQDKHEFLLLNGIRHVEFGEHAAACSVAGKDEGWFHVVNAVDYMKGQGWEMQHIIPQGLSLFVLFVKASKSAGK